MGTRNDELLTALLDEVRYLKGTATELAAHLRSGAVNGVLEVATLAIDSSGSVQRSYNTACGSLILINSSTHAMTVASGGATGAVAPTTGRGILPVPASSWLPAAIDAHNFTIYGTAGDVFGLMAFTGMHAFGFTR